MKIPGEGQHNHVKTKLAPADCQKLFTALESDPPRALATCEECPGPPECIAENGKISEWNKKKWREGNLNVQSSQTDNPKA